MGLDELMYRLPFVGLRIQRLYSYFRKNIAFTDAIHVFIGLGIGLIIAGGSLFVLGIILFLLGIFGHIYAFMKGKSGGENE